MTMKWDGVGWNVMNATTPISQQIIETRGGENVTCRPQDQTRQDQTRQGMARQEKRSEANRAHMVLFLMSHATNRNTSKQRLGEGGERGERHSNM
mmetsp:Transcript_828/g.1829  ORF Transcript_828/g.1829 Transcript_828/m.1829 type:complete len:95 (-) Transcript_828:12-296(-)